MAEDTGGKTVLVVDDDQDVRSLVALVLEEEGYRVETASNGREGLEVLERAVPDLILLDVKMPEMDAPEFAHAFRNMYDSLAPIVLMTGSANAQAEAADIGAEGWIGKPFELEALLSTVDRHIKQEG